jgi:hypothetical protein
LGFLFVDWGLGDAAEDGGFQHFEGVRFERRGIVPARQMHGEFGYGALDSAGEILAQE